ncbi:FAD linked oxidase domain-containing protein [Diaporthe sp. PMI_573]|nr:FAD linked oxidase domain-containing protein [Diaporthaceae sp. PMI_573]
MLSLVPADLRGDQYRVGDPGYKEARLIFNMRRDNCDPALIVRPADVADLQALMRHAYANNIPVAVRGGGHGPDADAMPHNQLVVDMSQWNDVAVDAVNRVLRAGAGTTLGELDAAGYAHGLVVPAGTVSHTGIAGLTLGGGVGFNMRRFGATVDNLLACELVTADGRLVRADDTENPELIWALRGGGGNFGVVTTFEYRAHPYPSEVGLASLFFGLDEARGVLLKSVEFMKTAPRELQMIPTLQPLPPLPGVPQELHGAPGVWIVCVYSGDQAKFDAVIQSVAALGKPAAVEAHIKPWLEVNSFLNASAPYGRRTVTRGTYFSVLTEEMVDNMIAAALRAPELPTHGPSSVQELWIYAGGAIVEDFDEDSCAFSREGALGFYEVVAQWDLPEADEENLSWVNETADVVTKDCMASGYSNFSWDLGLEWRRGLFGKPEKWDRLLATKKKWDPKNLLRFNKNFPVN